MGLASLFPCTSVSFSLRSFGIHVNKLSTSPGAPYHSAGRCCAQQCTRAGRHSLLAGAARIARLPVSFGWAARSPATRRWSSLGPAAPRRCRSRRRTTPKMYSEKALAPTRTNRGACPGAGPGEGLLVYYKGRFSTGIQKNVCQLLCSGTWPSCCPRPRVGSRGYPRGRARRAATRAQHCSRWTRGRRASRGAHLPP